jgi:hypothetical protein
MSNMPENKTPCPITMVAIVGENWRGYHNLIHTETGIPIAGPVHPSLSKAFLDVIEVWNQRADLVPAVEIDRSKVCVFDGDGCDGACVAGPDKPTVNFSSVPDWRELVLSLCGKPKLEAHKNCALGDDSDLMIAYMKGVSDGKAAVDLKMVLEVLKKLTPSDTDGEYETEYDGRMYTLCHGCSYQDDNGKGHEDDCTYKKLNKLANDTIAHLEAAGVK